MAMRFEWSPEKNEELKRERGISFEEIALLLGAGKLWAVTEPLESREASWSAGVSDSSGRLHLRSALCCERRRHLPQDGVSLTQVDEAISTRRGDSR